jgi:hypothetical protein
MSQSHFSDQSLETFTVFGRGSGLPEIGVNDDNSVLWPPKSDRSLSHIVLPFRALGVLHNLA